MADPAGAVALKVETPRTLSGAPDTDAPEHRQPPARRLLYNAGYLGASQFTTWAATLLYTIVVTRAIGPAGNGAVSAAGAVASVLSLAVGLGVATYIVKEVARDRARAPGLTGAALTVQAAALFPAAIGMGLYVVLNRFDVGMTLVLILYAGGVVPATCAATLQASLQGIQRMGVIAASGIAANLFFNLVSVALALTGHISVVVLGLLVVPTQTVSALITAGTYRRHFTIQWRTSRRQVADLVRQGVPFLATSVAFTLYVAADTIILTTLSSPAEVGWYGAATRLFTALLVGANILGPVWLPRLSAHAHLDRDAFRQEVRLLARLGLVAALPIAAGGIVVAPRIVDLLWGSAFAGAVTPLTVLLLTLPATSLSIVLYQGLVARGLAGWWARVMGVALAVNVIANVVLVLLFRGLGDNTALAASLCLCLTEYGMTGAAVWVTRHDLGRPMLWYALRALAAAGLMGFATLFLSSLPLAGVVACAAAVFVVLALALRLVTREELGLVRSLLDRKARR